MGFTAMVLATRVGLARCNARTPDDERQRAAADAEPGTGDPLRRAEAAQHGELIGQQTDGDHLSDEQATRPNGRSWPKGERRLSAVGMPERTFTVRAA